MLAILFGIGTFQSLIFALLLLTKKNRKKADLILVGFFLTIALYFFNISSSAFNLWRVFPNLIFLISLVTLTIGPWLYFYVLSLIGIKTQKKQLFLHLAAIVILFSTTLSLSFYSKEIKLLYFTDKFIKLPRIASIGLFIQYLLAPFYFAWIILILRKYKKHLKDSYSSMDKIDLDWMRKLLIGAIIFWTMDCLNIYALNYTDIDYPYITSFYIKLLFMSFIIAIGYYGIKQGCIFVPAIIQPISESNSLNGPTTPFVSDKTTENNVKLTKEPTNSCEVKSKQIPDEIAEKHLQTLKKYMSEEKAYLNCELRIQDVASCLKIPTHMLSYIINKKSNQNFYDFVNEYRIKEMKKRLHDSTYKNLTIVAIAYDCGFNSKATFNRLFKKFTGITPTQYKNKNN